MIDKSFISILKARKVGADFASAFRSDWTIEEYLSKGKRRVLAANDEGSLKSLEFFYRLLGIRHKTLSSIKEAEIYENAKNSFQYVTSSFINQLALAYPDTNVRDMTRYLLEDVELNETHLCIGAGGYKMPSSVKNLIDGSADPNFLSLIKEAEDANLSMILNYAEVIKKRGLKSAVILGLSVKGDQKSIELSPSVILAEYLNKLNIKVCVDDPFYGKASLSKILPFCKSTDILKEGLESDCLFVMADHDKYRYITQSHIDSLGICKAKMVIDNVSLFKEFKFSASTVYHAVGDGTLKSF
jgi:UDP-N-acetyl-D-mannosaminuronate dehydrogenase